MEQHKAKKPTPPKRAWVTPTFEQVPLKQALISNYEPTANDGDSDSS